MRTESAKSVTINGTGFLNGMTVKLTKPNNADIVATNVQTISPTQLTCTLNLTGAAIGQWTVVVTHHANDGGQSGSLAQGFTVGVPPPSMKLYLPMVIR